MADERDTERGESYGALLKNVPLWFWIAIIAPIAVGVWMALGGRL